VTAQRPEPVSGVTVALACYNQAHFLADALQSVLVQSRPADKVILVDDGSTDDTAGVAGRFPGVTYHWQANAGLSEARNTALRLATTRHILFLDADDMVWPDMVERALACFAANPGIAFAYGGYRDVTADGAPIASREAVRQDGDMFVALLHDNFIGMHGTVLYDVEKLRSIDGFDPALRSCEDYDVYLKLARRYPACAYPGIGADYRRHGGGMSTSAARMSRIVRHVLQRQIAGGLDARQLRAARGGLAFYRRFYSHQLIGALRRNPRALLPIVGQGVREDPAFLFRLMGVAVSAVISAAVRGRGSRGAGR
jgi:hypothetical protein